MNLANSYEFGYYTSLTNVEFADDSQLVSIGESSFMNSAITSIKIPSTMKFIGSKLFISCKNLERFFFTENSKLESFSNYIFSNTKIEEITVPVHLKRIDASFFPNNLKINQFY